MAMRDEASYPHTRAMAADPAGEIMAAMIILLTLAGFLIAGITVSIVLDRLINMLAHVSMPMLAG